MICAECGADNLAGRTYCGTCGKPMRPDRERVLKVTQEKAVAEARYRWAKGWSRMLAFSVVLFLVACAFRSAFSAKDLPRFGELPTVSSIRRLPALDSEVLLHPWIELPLPEGAGK